MDNHKIVSIQPLAFRVCIYLIRIKPLIHGQINFKIDNVYCKT